MALLAGIERYAGSAADISKYVFQGNVTTKQIENKYHHEPYKTKAREAKAQKKVENFGRATSLRDRENEVKQREEEVERKLDEIRKKEKGEDQDDKREEQEERRERGSEERDGRRERVASERNAPKKQPSFASSPAPLESLPPFQSVPLRLEKKKTHTLSAVPTRKISSESTLVVYEVFEGNQVFYFFRRLFPFFGLARPEEEQYRYELSDYQEGSWAECSVVMKQAPPTEEEWRKMPFSNIPYPEVFRLFYTGKESPEDEEEKERIPKIKIFDATLSFRFTVHEDANLRTANLSRSYDNAFQVLSCSVEPKKPIKEGAEKTLPYFPTE